jgi:hypothetical protein
MEDYRVCCFYIVNKSSKGNQNIKVNLNDIETEKEKISNKIKELSSSIEEKANVVSTDFIGENL